MREEILLSVNPARVAVDPGGVAVVALQIQNRSSVVDEFEVEVLGDAAAWTSVDEGRVPIFPQGTGSVQVSVRPPRSSRPEAGTIAVGFRVRSTVDPERSVVEECSVEVKPFVEIGGEVSPKTARGRFSAGHQLRVINKGNAAVSVSVRAEVQQGDCQLSLPEGPLMVAAGERRTTQVKVRPSHSHWQGGDEMHQYRFSLEPQGGAPVVLDAMMRQRPIARIPTTLLVALALVLGGAYVVYGKGPNPLQTALHWSGAVQTTPSAAPIPSPATPTHPPTQPPTGNVGADISVNPLTLDWSALPGAPGTVLATHVSNGASSGQATVTGFQVQGDTSYVIDPTTTCTAGMTLNPGQQCDIVVAFRPQAKGPHEASLQVTGAGGSVKTVGLSFNPAPPSGVSPSPTPTFKAINPVVVCLTTALTSVTLNDTVSGSTHTLAWQGNAGCGPFTGTIVATYAHLYRCLSPCPPWSVTYNITGESGIYADQVPTGARVISYKLTLNDGYGNSATATAS